MKPLLILASSSPRRQCLLKEYGYHIEVHSPEVDEIKQGDLSALEVVRINARLKADVVAQQFSQHLVLAADTVVDVDGKVFGKPQDFADAKRMLGILQGRTHQVITAVCLIHRTNRKHCEIQDFTRVKFFPLSDMEIQRYLEEIQPMDKAGAYAAQDAGGHIIAQIEGSRTNVIGLPMERLSATLKQHFPDY